MRLQNQVVQMHAKVAIVVMCWWIGRAESRFVLQAGIKQTPIIRYDKEGEVCCNYHQHSGPVIHANLFVLDDGDCMTTGQLKKFKTMKRLKAELDGNGVTHFDTKEDCEGVADDYNEDHHGDIADEEQCSEGGGDSSEQFVSLCQFENCCTYYKSGMDESVAFENTGECATDSDVADASNIKELKKAVAAAMVGTPTFYANLQDCLDDN